MTVTKTPSSNFNVPTVDLAPYFADPNSIEALKIVNQVRDACITTGFFQLIGHGIPRGFQDEVFGGSAALFNLPIEEKKKLDKSESVGASNRGYELIGNQGLQEGTLPDLREGFYIGKEIPASDPRVQNNAFLMGPNLWPPSSLVPEHLFREPMEKYYELMLNLTLTVMDILAAGLPYGPNVFQEFVSNDPVASIRLLHYPPQTTDATNQLGSGAHTDFGAITLLLQDEIGGLQVWNGEGKVWVNITPNKNAYVVNVGDMLQMWTGGKYKSALHRVINRSNKDRYSIPFFFDGNIECVLKPLDGSPAVGEPLTVEGHMRERFASTYGRGKKRDDEKPNFKV
ncbi:2-oxoglutarate-dependent dioxygenase mpl2 [Hyphodiscus hymeniophilus]|uniref:2-oxoglutarate-dependent dioxygenase mpl2 n=1 Tax=Hyphodiscus hymeniophilus TaxID=353542 RepID=A0A9P6VLF6_9HELO|nr:2-oxoglutarate-dependent dioxygenase mpl2 [Hyphodiscus hymeniophilus]